MKRVLITGGTRGIGLATARRFLQAGYQVLAWALTPASIEEAHHALAALPEADHFAAMVVDIRDHHAVQEGFAETLHRLGGLDVLVNNAGWTRT
ncbi:MAG: SDR family oxidoreductase, partial [Alicyclobacillus shizuokensis]|nr:SDR family oxidoreductase [Alicyclobacillus shizuokensis]